MNILKYLGAAAAGAMMFASAGNAVTVDTFDGVGGASSGVCVSAACTATAGLPGNGNGAAFLLPADFEASGSGKFFGASGEGLFTHTFEFEHTVGDVIANFNTVNTPSDFTGLTFSWFGSGLGAGLILSGGSTPVTASFAMAMGSLYTLVVSGTSVSSGQYDWSVNVVPIPAALPLFGTGLGILGFLGWRRRRNQNAQAAV